ncbi:GAF domain-containing protein [Sphingomonas silueang]|uniref:GAF domain-containing protein n=1 Tax=Sphingomonas silueang TaxID=3156617 RepID=UPI0032B4169E
MGATSDVEGQQRRLAVIDAYRLRSVGGDPALDDLVRLAARACAAPVALVTVLDTDEQRFVARAGTDLSGTAIEHALCVHALDVPDLLVIPDLGSDPRTRDNPIVTGGPAVRFYAGVPLRLGDATVIGTLCVLDVVPRPEGLDAEQQDTLLRLARQVVTTLELRRSLAERDAALTRIAAAERQLSSEERRWQQLFENMGDGFALGEVLRDDAGRVVDWRYLDANPAWFALSGFDRATMLAGTGRALDPNAPAHWTQDLERLLDNGVPVGFVHRAVTRGRWFRGRCFRIEDDRFGVILHDTTDELAAASRQAALIQLGDALRDCHSIADVTHVACALVGETLGVTRAAFGRVDAALTHIDVGPDWTSGGARSVAGRHRFADFGPLCDPMANGTAVVIEDVRADPRSSALQEMMDALHVGALVKMPVRRDGRIAAIFMVHDTAPRRWTPEELVFLRKVADRVEVGVTQVEAEIQQSLLVHELAHRLKNTLSMVQAIASQTLRGLVDRAPLESFEKRLQALGVAHDVLVDRNWVGADLRATVRQVIAVFGCDDRIVLTGPEVALGARAALGLALILHELGTNALKYGALSNATGQVTLAWAVEDEVLTLEWREVGGPPVTAPARRGFGTKLLGLGLAGTGGSRIDYAPEGVRAVMRATLDELTGG